MEKADMAGDGLSLKGEVRFKLMRANGSIQEWMVHNLLVDIGKPRIAAILGAESLGYFTKIGLGASAVTPMLDDTALNSPLGEATGVLSADGATTRLEAMFMEGVATGVIEEGGIFCQDDTMISHFLTTTFTKNALDRLLVQWNLIVE